MTEFPQLNENENRDQTMGVIIKFDRPSPIQRSIKQKILYSPSFERTRYLFGYSTENMTEISINFNDNSVNCNGTLISNEISLKFQ